MSDRGAPTTLIAMIALDTDRFPTAAETIATLQAQNANIRIGDLEERDKERLYMFKIGDNKAAILFMPGPIPWQDLEGPCAAAWWWPQATEVMRAHRYHVVVMLLGNGGTAVARHIELGHVAAAVAVNSDAVGIYCGSGGLVRAAAPFVDHNASLTLEDFDPRFWVDFRTEPNDDGGHRFFTTGLTAFGHLELEIHDTRMPPAEILEFCYGVVSYILAEDVDLQDGETIGRGGDEAVRISHRRSIWNLENKVVHLAL